MKLARLRLVNFLSHEDTVLTFEDGLVCLFGRNLDKPAPDASNGSGKSSIFFAILWGLWGRILKGMLGQEPLKNDIIREYCDSALVEIEMVGRDGGRLLIERTKSSKVGERVTAHWNGQKLGDEVATVQPVLESIYGISWTAFCNTVYLGPQSEVAQFVRTTDQQRALLLAELINDKPFQEAAKRVESEMSLLKTEAERALAAVQQLQQSEQTVLQTMQRLSQSYADEEFAQRRREEASRKQAHDLELRILECQERLKQPPTISPIELQGRSNTLEEADQRSRARIAGLEFRLNQRAPEVGSPCVTCGQVFTPSSQHALTETKLGLDEELRSERKTLQSILEGKQQLQRQMAEVQSWAATKAQLEREIDHAKQQLHLLKSSLTNRTLAVLHNERESAGAQLMEVRKLLGEKQQQAATANLRIPVLKTLHVGLKSEIRNMLLDEVRAVLQFYTAQFTEALEPGLQIEYPPVTATGKERFEVVVKSAGRVNRLTSGGESYRAQLSVLLALSLAMRQQQKSPFQFLMIDEALSYVDPEGQRAFARLMQALGGHFTQIFVTSPAELEEMHKGRVLVVEKQHRKSRVVEG